MKIQNSSRLIISILACELVGSIGSIFTSPAIPGWYAGLVKPAFNPPNWIFGPVWTMLFAMMGIAAWLVWNNLASKSPKVRQAAKLALIIFVIQFALNVLWSIIFFGQNNPDAAFIEIIILWLAILATIIAFARISKAAAWLLVPYILWVSFASLLNYSIWQLNTNKPIGYPEVKIDKNQIMCTMEAKLCPDGSAVGRSGPNCEFAECGK